MDGGAGPVQRWQPYMGYDPLKRRGFGQTAVRNADVVGPFVPGPFVPGVPAKPAPPPPNQTRDAGGAPAGYNPLKRRGFGQTAVRNADVRRTVVPETPDTPAAQDDQANTVEELVRRRKEREGGESGGDPGRRGKKISII